MIQDIERKLAPRFKVLNGLPESIAIEQTEEAADLDVSSLLSVVDCLEQAGLHRVSVTLLEHSKAELGERLQKHGFEHYASKVTVRRALSELPKSQNFSIQSLDHKELTEEQFKELWELCMSQSDNAPTSLSINQHLHSVKSELGQGWEQSCIVLYEGIDPLGIAIPHIEPGTRDEGRLFYFGVLPTVRAKGKGTEMHLKTLWLLKEMGASYYIGSTHRANQKMQRVFEKNGCHVTRNTEVYYKYFIAEKNSSV